MLIQLSTYQNKFDILACFRSVAHELISKEIELNINVHCSTQGSAKYSKNNNNDTKCVPVQDRKRPKSELSK